MTPEPRAVGIVSIYDLDNYGNRLQNYAVHRILASRGYEARTLLIHRRYILGIIAARIRNFRKRCMWWKTESRRYRNFHRFDRLIRHAGLLSRRHLERSKDAYAFFVVGSDQIWNPHFFNSKGRQFLDWTYDFQRIALAPSFGVAELPRDVWADYTQGLNLFANLSVREEAGAQLIQDLTGRDATVLIDPTLVLTASEWRTLVKRSARPLCPYILTYFLGTVSLDQSDNIQRFAELHSLSVVSLMEHSSPLHESGPAEFIDLIDNAECVFTDSYHGSAFSLLLEKPVTIFGREDHHDSMSSRMDTFVRTFGLEDRLYSASGLHNAMSADGYAQAHDVLQAERKRFLDYLDKEITRVEASLEARVVE